MRRRRTGDSPEDDGGVAAVDDLDDGDVDGADHLQAVVDVLESRVQQHREEVEEEILAHVDRRFPAQTRRLKDLCTQQQQVRPSRGERKVLRIMK